MSKTGSAYLVLRRAYDSDVAGYELMMSMAANSRTLKEADYWLSQAVVFAESAIETLDVIDRVQGIVYAGLSPCAKHEKLSECTCEPPF